MRLSYSLNKNIMETGVGGIINKFIVKKRRSVLFFEDILANYIKECEEAGYGKEMEKIAEKWMIFSTPRLLPKYLKKSMFSSLFISLMKKVWVNIGLVDEIKFVKTNDIVKIKTRNEFITRCIGNNIFMAGLYRGIIGGGTGSKVESIDMKQTKDACIYTIKIKNMPFKIIGKNKKTYDNLNYLPDNNGFNLKNGLKTGILKLNENNKILFRQRPLILIENTLFHLISNKNILFEKVPHISYNYFKYFIEDIASNERKLLLLKNILQIMGWGTIKLKINDKKEVLFEIKNLPYGLQKEKDCWNFLINVILGYLWVINKKFKLSSIKTHYKCLQVCYSVK